MCGNAPLYIVSKGRWQEERRLTSRALERMRLPYSMIVEESEVEQYRAAVDPALCTMLILDPAYQRDYNTLDDLGDSKSKGPGPARNFAWQHAIDSGAARHWVLDDNIKHFARLYRNRKIHVRDGSLFRAMEDFVGRYANVAMAGPFYRGFVDQSAPLAPFILNTRIYSCNLIRNDVPFRWRGRYNEDTILSLDMLKAGWCTVEFYAFMQDKVTTQMIKGGNTDEFYIKEGTRAKSEMQVRVHPDVSRLVWKFNRWHHHVDYSRFKRNRLIRNPDAVIPEGVNEYGMKLVKVERGQVVAS